MRKLPSKEAPATWPQALVDYLSQAWNRAIEVGYANRWDGPIGALGQLMLVVAGTKPTAISLRDPSWNSRPVGWARRCRDAGLVIDKIEVLDSSDSTWLVARERASAESVEAILRAWSDARENRGPDSPTWQLGLALGYPYSAVEAYAGLRPRAEAEKDPDWPAEELAWWRVLGCFVPASDPLGLDEARRWLTGAREQFQRTFPAGRAPTASQSTVVDSILKPSRLSA